MVGMPEISDIDPIGSSLMLLTQTSRLINKYIDSYFYQKANLSFIKFMTLKSLASNDGMMNHSELAQWTQTERNNITALVARMKREELITTEYSNKDRRVINVILTNKGREALNQAMPIAREIIENIMSSISEKEAAKCRHMFEVLKDNASNGLESINRG